MTSPYFFFRPLVAADQSWAAMDWQSENPKTGHIDFARCFSGANASLLAKNLQLVVTAEPEWFTQGGVVDAYEAGQVIFILPASCLVDAQVIERCKFHHSQGYRFGVHIDKSETIRNVPLAVFDFLRFDAACIYQDIEASDLAYAQDAGFGKIASKVGSHDMFHWLSERSFDLCDSQFLKAHHSLQGRDPDLARLKLLKLLNLVKDDGDTREIEAIFREEPKLSYNLLRLVNFVAVGARTKISNFSQAIAILGRRQLQRWLQLLVYANNLADANTPNPLMQLAAARGHLLELLSAQIDPASKDSELKDHAFLTGLFSLLDVLINLPMKEIVKELPMHEDVVEALLTPGQGGILSQLLAAIAAGEAGNFGSAIETLTRLNISPETFAKAQVDSFYWASHINVEHQD